MNTSKHPWCQTHARLTFALAALLAPLAPFAATGQADPSPSPAPPLVQQLQAAQFADLAASAAPTDPAFYRRLDDLFTHLAVDHPDAPAVRKAAGNHFWRVGQTAVAVAEWQAAQRLDPKDPEVASSLGEAALRDGEVRQARSQFQRAVDSDPDVPLYHFQLANVLFTFRHDLGPSSEDTVLLRESLTHFRRAAELAPASLDYAQAYAESFYGLREPAWDEALAAWQHVLALTPDASDFANSHLARISLRLGQPENARHYLDRIQSPDFVPVKAQLTRQADQMRQPAP